MIEKDKIKNRLDFLINPITIVIAIIIAVVIGLLGSQGSSNVAVNERSFYDWVNTVVTFLMPFGNMYLNLLRMTVYPILVAAIISSIAGLVKSPEIGKFLTRMLVCFLIMVLFAALLGTLAGTIGRPGAYLSNDAKTTLNKSIEESEYKVDLEISLSEVNKVEKKKGNFIDFFVNMVPENIFKSFADEIALQLVFFSIMFGIAIGMIKGNKSDFIITMFDGIFKAFQKIINWLMYILPFGLIFLLAGQITSSQKFLKLLGAMFWFIILFYIVGLITIIINTIIIWKRSKENFIKVFQELLDPVIIALATRSSFATMPSAIKALDQRLKFYESTTKLYLPLGITLGRFGNIIYFAMAALFVNQLYGAPMTAGVFFIVVLGSIFAGTATAGATGLATLSLMSIVLAPLGLPVEAVLILFMTIDTIIDPMRTLLIVHSNMAVNALVADKAPSGDRRSEIRSLESVVGETSLIDKIKSKGEIRVAFTKKNVPLFHTVDKEGNYSGIDIDLAEKISNEFNVKLIINDSAESEDELIDLLNDDKADFAVSNINSKSDITNHLAVTRPYLSFHMAMIINKEQSKGKDIKSLISGYNGKMGVVKKYNAINPLNKVFPNAEIFEYENYSDLLEAVGSGVIFAGYGNEIDFKLILSKTKDLNNKISCAVFRNTEDSYVIAVSQKNKNSIHMFNRAINDEWLTLNTDQFIKEYKTE